MVNFSEENIEMDVFKTHFFKHKSGFNRMSGLKPRLYRTQVTKTSNNRDTRLLGSFHPEVLCNDSSQYLPDP